MIQYALAKCTEEEISGLAASKGHLEIVQLLQKHSSRHFSSKILVAAIRGRRLEVLEFVHTNHKNNCNQQTTISQAFQEAVDEKNWGNCQMAA